jgi:exosome complex component MTR3
MVCKTSSQKDLVLDPSWEEERLQTGALTLAVMSTHNEVTQIVQTGEFEADELSAAMDLCQDACGKLHRMMQQYLTDNLRAKSKHSTTSR